MINMSHVMAAYAGVEEATIARRAKKGKSTKQIKATEYLEGNVFCFTGKMDRVRSDIQQELFALGGDSTYNWRSDVTVLVKKDIVWHSIKVDKALAKGIPIITEMEYDKLMEIVREKRGGASG